MVAPSGYQIKSLKSHIVQLIPVFYTNCYFFPNLRLRGTTDVKDEMDDMRVEHEAIKSLPHVSFKDMIVNPALRSPLIIGNKRHALKNMLSLL